MVNFFKSFGRGILYVLILPLLLVVLAVYGVVSIIVFLIMGVKFLILFFTGRSLFDDLPEDKQAKAILAANAPKTENVTVDINNLPRSEDIAFENRPIIPSENYDNPSIEEKDPFYVPEYLKPHAEEKEIELSEEKPLEQQEYQPEEDEAEQEFEYSPDFNDMRRREVEEEDVPSPDEYESEERGVSFTMEMEDDHHDEY